MTTFNVTLGNKRKPVNVELLDNGIRVTPVRTARSQGDATLFVAFDKMENVVLAKPNRKPHALAIKTIGGDTQMYEAADRKDDTADLLAEAMQERL